MNERPVLSIVVASIDPGTAIDECLTALGTQRTAAIEVVVVDGSTDRGGTAERVRRRFPWTRVLTRPQAASLPRLRGLGIAEASAPIVGLLDAWCVVGEGWAAAATRAHDDASVAAVGGPVELPASATSLAARTSYLFDYWEFVPPIRAGHATVLAGNNIVYKRSVLGETEMLRRDGFWKAFVNAELKARGNVLVATPELGVALHRHASIGNFIRSRFHHGRSYAAMRVRAASMPARLLWASLTPALPALFVWRQLRGLIDKGKYFRWFLACLPLLVACHVSWALGEAFGYVAGAGRSDDAIRS